MRFRKPMTAAEAMAQLQSDPEWVRQHEEREAKWKAKGERLRAEEAPLIVELAQAGYAVKSVWDLVNARWNYPDAIPVLVKHLGLAYDPRIHEGIIRALTVPEARGEPAHVLLHELVYGEYASGADIRWVLANALTVAADATMTEELRGLVQDPRFEDVRQRLTVAFKRSIRRRPKRGKT